MPGGTGGVPEPQFEPLFVRIVIHHGDEFKYAWAKAE
jgi:hypothetical protein